MVVKLRPGSGVVSEVSYMRRCMGRAHKSIKDSMGSSWGDVSGMGELGCGPSAPLYAK